MVNHALPHFTEYLGILRVDVLESEEKEQYALHVPCGRPVLVVRRNDQCGRDDARLPDECSASLLALSLHHTPMHPPPVFCGQCATLLEQRGSWLVKGSRVAVW